MNKKFIYFTILTLACIYLYNLSVRSSNGIYNAMFGVLPASVIVINSEDQAFLDCCIWLHYKIDNRDLKQILDTIPEKIAVLNQWKNSETPEWWQPRLFGKYIKYYEWRSPDHRRTKAFYVNREMTEVYYVDQAGH